MNKAEIAAYFDRASDLWDQERSADSPIIFKILQGAGCTAGKSILDVACGTGILIPYYLKAGVSSVTAIDIAPGMVQKAREKFPDPRVNILCGDVETTAFSRKFDCIMVYNAFPHFPDPEHLIRVLSGLTAPGGTLTVAHGMSRKNINHCHEGSAANVSRGLPEAEDLAHLFRKYMTVTAVISDDSMYQVTGKR